MPNFICWNCCGLRARSRKIEEICPNCGAIMEKIHEDYERQSAQSGVTEHKLTRVPGPGADGLSSEGATDVCHAVILTGAILGESCIIGEGATIGLGAIIRPQIKVGAGAHVSMGGAVVTQDVPPGMRVSGNFAVEHNRFIRRVKRWAES